MSTARDTIPAMMDNRRSRRSISPALLAAVVALVPLFAVREARAQGAIGIATSITVQQFMQELSSYGTWTSDERWGWVWQPRGVLPGWRPYAQGQWLVAEGYGMYWQSYEPFG